MLFFLSPLPCPGRTQKKKKFLSGARRVPFLGVSVQHRKNIMLVSKP